MSFTYQDRLSDSPFVETIWHTQSEKDGCYLAVADGSWDMLILREKGRIRLSVWGPMTKATPMLYSEGSQYMGIRFKLGTYLTHVPPKDLLDTGRLLPEATCNAFWLGSSTWEFPDYENVEVFINRLVRNGLLERDPVVGAVLKGESPDLSLRSVQRRFLYTTGLTHVYLKQIQRAHHAKALLQQGMPIMETAYHLGYTDQPHMTRSLKHFIGQTPAQIMQLAAG